VRSSRPEDRPITFKHKGDIQMRCMILVKADKNSEAGVLPDQEILTEMGKYNEALAAAGVLLAAEGLHSSSKGARVRFSGSTRTVIDGPFAETKELIAGFWLWQVKSMEEAIEWVKRCPMSHAEIEIRQVFEAEDFGPAFTPELREQEERLRTQIDAKR
jgi:hypothetical protein